MNMANWMSNLHGDLTLKDIVMPGSHDAGVYGLAEITERGGRLEWSKCQFSNFFVQASAGARFFDLRVFAQKVKQKKTKFGLTVPGRTDLRAGHFMIEKSKKSKLPYGGGYGGSLVAILRDSCAFVEAFPTEFVILRFSHAKHPDLIVEAVRFFVRNMSLPCR